ncbi:LytR/AlgR family response regulator transcription factor [Leeuwenhoekiella parthenopeia]|uniref:Response regulator transcription factor n=1 Tax=Leeuwenhoekiella parthenopeia TaxID=2890320 RepID=A0ABS8GSX3_9FLAO|nr:response regulator transcription factor [Leeuwenhoekiella parthenopeia]MCC4213095.1 response regulator transcription factor [Leeuwenhoekiella parthenopeia]
MRCIIVDDEPLALDVLSSYLEKIEGIELVARCTSPLDAVNILSSDEVIDLVFLDIEMPNLTGIELVKSLDRLPQFIFTTAYPQYALEGFDLNATDYLVKPVPFHRFLKAVSRAREKYDSISKQAEPKSQVSGIIQENVPDFIFVKSEYENIKIDTADIKYLQGLKDYIKIYTYSQTKAILTLSSFKELLDKLPAASFIRVHRSYVVNINAIRAVQKSRVIIGEMRIPIGETYKDEVLKKLHISG